MNVLAAVSGIWMPSRSSGGGGITLETRLSSLSGSPMKKSASNGLATSSAKKAPMDLPVMRRTTSPIRYPWVRAWYPEAVPGSHHGSCAAKADVQNSQSASRSGAIGTSQPDRPAVWPIRCRTSTRSLPPWANSGQYVATGAWKSSWLLSASMRAHKNVMVFVVDHTLVMVSRSHGALLASSTNPPQMSTTGSPCR